LSKKSFQFNRTFNNKLLIKTVWFFGWKLFFYKWSKIKQTEKKLLFFLFFFWKTVNKRNYWNFVFLRMEEKKRSFLMKNMFVVRIYEYTRSGWYFFFFRQSRPIRRQKSNRNLIWILPQKQQIFIAFAVWLSIWASFYFGTRFWAFRDF
jgi:hypothetical protein